MFFFSYRCPICGNKGNKVKNDTMIHHVKDISKMGDRGYFFCSNSECDVVYFQDKETFTINMVNKEIGLKNTSSSQSSICYCYNYPRSELYDESIIDKINIRIENYGSRCDIRNPSGRCCLKDIKHTQKECKEEDRHNVFKKTDEEKN